MQVDFENKVVIVTGSGRGIGKEIAVQFASCGATVILSDYKKDLLEEVERSFSEFGFKYRSLPCDVTDEASVKELMDISFSEFGRIDVLVNNAGITRDTLLLRMNEEQWDSVIATNLKGVFLTTKAAVRYLLKQKFGRIINISSVVGLQGNAGQSNYAASKAGIIGFSKSVARELAVRNITVNVIAPGFIDTSMTATLSDAIKENFINQIPMKRIGVAKDIASVALFLASPLAEYVTGQVINVDGGMLM